MKETKEAGLPVLAVDIGGTKIITALISNKGQVMAKEYHLTLADEGPPAVINRILVAIGRLLNVKNMGLSQLDSISIAAAGAINFNKGVITVSPNLPGWYDVPLKDMVKEKYQVNTFLINDANAAALAEHRFGVGKGTKNLVYLTVSTGIGSGIITDGELYMGTSGSAGEIGHMTIDVNGVRNECGNVGCWETLASGTAVAKEAVERIRRGEESYLTEIVEGKLENITAEQVSTAAQNGDSLALEIIMQAATYLGVGLVNLVNIFNPEIVVIGGGMSRMGELLFDPARKVVGERAFPVSAEVVRIVPAQLGNNAEVIGAAIFARQQKTRGDTRPV